MPLNIYKQIHKIGYVVVDVETDDSTELLQKLRQIDGTIRLECYFSFNLDKKKCGENVKNFTKLMLKRCNYQIKIKSLQHINVVGLFIINGINLY